jgi:FAD-linked sulfhydryl oxidase
MPRRQHVTVFMMIALAAILTFSFVWTFSSKAEETSLPDYDAYTPLAQEPVLLDDGILRGAATAPKLENATLKYASP